MRWPSTPGRSDAVVLELPAGDYVLVATIGPAAMPCRLARPRTRRRPSAMPTCHSPRSDRMRRRLPAGATCRRDVSPHGHGDFRHDDDDEEEDEDDQEGDDDDNNADQARATASMRSVNDTHSVAT
jgi:hypothetical protein